MSTVSWFVVFMLAAWRHSAAAQGYQSLIQYFETDSTARHGYSSVEEKTTQPLSSKSREHTGTSTVESFYDTPGRLIREERRSHTGAEIHLVFGYDSTSGRINHIVQTGGRVKYEALAQYDDEGRLVEIVHCPEDKACDIRHYVYDEDNTERLYVPRQTIELKFDKEKPGTLFGFSARNEDKDELVRERFFDPEGKLEEIRQYTGDTLAIGWLFEYDPMGRKSRVWVYNKTEKALAAENEYDERSGLLLSEKIYVWVVGSKILPYRDLGPETTFLIYDANNRLIKTESGNKNSGKTREYIYNEY